MSNYVCSKCNTVNIDSSAGYLEGCDCGKKIKKNKHDSMCPLCHKSNIDCYVAGCISSLSRQDLEYLLRKK